MTRFFTFDRAENESQVRDLAPWVDVVVEVEGGFLAFDSSDEYEVWKNQE